MQENTIAQPPSDQPSPPDLSPPQEKEGWRSILSTILILVAAPLIALFLITFIFQSYEVDGPSMETTLQDQDRLIVLKTGKTWASLTGGNYIPKRGEIIIFHQAGLFRFGDQNEKQLIKRVIALPGERVVVRDGIVTIYNEEHPNGFRPDAENDFGDEISPTPGNVDQVVPDGHVFVLGDNRDDSLDSRNFGPVASENIVGSLAIRIFPLNKIDTF